eukprot:42621_1
MDGILVGYMVGICVGLYVGSIVGELVGLSVGVIVGLLDGFNDGNVVGCIEGVYVGCIVGILVGVLVGFLDGFNVKIVGDIDGLFVGEIEGIIVYFVCDMDGVIVGIFVGVLLGLLDGIFVGDIVGCSVGIDTVGYPKYVRDFKPPNYMNNIVINKSIPPTNNPSISPTIFTLNPSKNPTKTPTKIPTIQPTYTPSIHPTTLPSLNPSNNPTITPTDKPTNSPTIEPTYNPTQIPTIYPTNIPSINPTKTPTIEPTDMPTFLTFAPTPTPTPAPTFSPTIGPTDFPTIDPTIHPTGRPTIPTISPTYIPTIHPTYIPTNIPTYLPTIEPTYLPIEPTYFTTKQNAILAKTKINKTRVRTEESKSNISQHQVFPWVLSDYDSEILDLNNIEIYRDLSKPMGAQTDQTEPRASEFKERYDTYEDSSGEVSKFHYGTRYSCGGIICYFLIRLEPFTRIALELQDGKFDHADRLFSSISYSYKLASETGGMQDVKELIPEFFYLNTFLINTNRFDYGITEKGIAIDDVLLPKWAYGDPERFIRMHRNALESEYVSLNLHKWIDLIFGYKQRGLEAIDAQNVFYPWTYEDA